MSSYRMKYKIGLVEHSIVVPEDISSIPLGTILPYSANTLNPPAGFLFCDGSAISRSMYPDLFALIGTLYGSGDDSTTFNLPNLIGKFPEGAGSAGTAKTAGLPNITGSVQSTSQNLKPTGAFANVYKSSSIGLTYSSGMDGSVDFDASRCSSVYGNSDTVQPPSLTVRYIIKAFVSISNESAILDVSNITSDIATRMQRQQIPAFNKRIEITTSQTWSTPISGWYKVTAKGGGGGGSGGYVVTSTPRYFPGAGGGEGGQIEAILYLEKDVQCVCSVGAGGAGGNATFNDTTQASSNNSVGGGSTTVTIGELVLTGGGGNRAYRQNGVGRGGSGGTASITSGTDIWYKITTGEVGGRGVGYTFSVSSSTFEGGYGGGCRSGYTGILAYGRGGTGGSIYSTAEYTSAGLAGTQGVVTFEYFDPESL